MLNPLISDPYIPPDNSRHILERSILKVSRDQCCPLDSLLLWHSLWSWVHKRLHRCPLQRHFDSQKSPQSRAHLLEHDMQSCQINSPAHGWVSQLLPFPAGKWGVINGREDAWLIRNGGCQASQITIQFGAPTPICTSQQQPKQQLRMISIEVNWFFCGAKTFAEKQRK